MLIILVAVLCLQGCGANYHLKRAKRHLLIAESKGAVISRDTVYKKIFVPVEKIVLDTVVHLQNITDTVYIDKEKIRVRFKVDSVYKLVYVNVECKADTVLIRVPVAVNTEVKPSTNRVLAIVLGCIAGGLCLLLLAVGYRRKRSREDA